MRLKEVFDIARCLARDALLVLAPEMDEVGYGADLEPVMFRELDQVGQPRHASVVFHDLAQHRRWMEAGELREVAAGLGVPGAHQHTARLRDEREHVARLDDVRGRRLRGSRHLDGVRPVGRRYSRGHAGGGFDGHREIGTVHRAVARHHGQEIQALGVCLGDRPADQAAAELRHEIYFFRGDELRGEDEIALVLAILVVDEHGHAAGFQLGDDFLDRVEAHGVVRPSANFTPNKRKGRSRAPRVPAGGPTLLLAALLVAFDFLADARALARELAHVVELGAAHVTFPLQLDRIDRRGISLESALDALARGHLAHRERGIDAAVPFGDDYALVGLHALALALDDADVDDHRVARGELGDFLPHALDFFLFELLNNVHRFAPWSNSCLNSSSSLRSPSLIPRRSSSSGLLSHVRPSDCFSRHRSICAWWPESSTGGTDSPAYVSGRVYCGQSRSPFTNESCAADAWSPSAPGNCRTTASISTIAASSPPERT